MYRKSMFFQLKKTKSGKRKVTRVLMRSVFHGCSLQVLSMNQHWQLT